MMVLLVSATTIPLGLDLYLPVPEDPLTAAKIALGRRLFFDRRLSSDQLRSMLKKRHFLY